MILAITCDENLNNIFYVVKNIVNIILIVAPIVAIISFSILLVKMTFSPEEKKLIKNLTNSLKAVVVIFFIPMLITIVMYALGDNNDISRCYLTASKIDPNSSYNKSLDKDKTGINNNPRDFEKGFPRQLDFSCKRNNPELKAHFSCETIHIVEKHLRDFNSSNYASVVGKFGGFRKYIKTLGGNFEDYYGKKLKVTKVYEFQRVSEYVFGYMTMYGFDYYNGVGGMDINDVMYCKWGGTCIFMADYERAVKEAEEKSKKLGRKVEPDITLSTATEDGFYLGQYMHLNHGTFPGASFDSGIVGNNMTTNCNNSVDMVYTKAGILGTSKRPYLSSQWEYQVADKNNKIISEFKDLQIGDIIHFFKNPVDSSNPSTWGNWGHVAYVGEIDYSTGKITAYDGGSSFTSNRDYKWSFDGNKTTSSLHGYPGWGAVRVVDLD